MSTDVKEQNFLFAGIDFHQKKGVEVLGVLSEVNGGETDSEDIKGWKTNLPHQNLSIPLRQNLRQFVADVLFDTRGLWILTGDPKQNELTERLKAPLERQRQHLISGIVITGIKKTGEKEWSSVVITGTKTLHSGKVVPFKTPAISLKNSTKYQWEPDLLAELEIIEHEAFKYRFKKVYGNPQLSDMDGNALEDLPQDQIEYGSKNISELPFGDDEESDMAGA